MLNRFAGARQWTLASLVVLAFSAAPFAKAFAHASLISSSPLNGSHVSVSPAELRLKFSEPVVSSLSHVMLGIINGHQMPIAVAGDPHEVRAIIARLPRLADGAYQATWHIISADGHPVSGTIVFTVGHVDSIPAITPAAHHDGQMVMSDAEPMLAGAALVPAILRGLALSALLSLCGMLGFIAYGSSSSAAQARMCGWLSLIATGLLLVHLIVWLIHVSPENKLDAAILEAALSREVGLNELLRLLFAALTAWAILLARQLRLAFALSLAAVIAGGAIGHSAAIDPVIAIPMKSLHLVGVAFWLGGLLMLATSDTAADNIAASAGIVSSVALISITVVGVTGIVQAFLFLPGWRDVFGSAYGVTLIGKAAGLALLAAFGAHHRYNVLPRLSHSSASALQKSVRREIGLMIIVVMLGGFLAYVPTPHIQ